jgi:hypothetical protein
MFYSARVRELIRPTVTQVGEEPPPMSAGPD